MKIISLTNTTKLHVDIYDGKTNYSVKGKSKLITVFLRQTGHYLSVAVTLYCNRVFPHCTETIPLNQFLKTFNYNFMDSTSLVQYGA